MDTMLVFFFFKQKTAYEIRISDSSSDVCSSDLGKTTTAINVATALAATGWKTLLVELDPQGNASTGLGIGHAERGWSSYHLLTGECALEEAAVNTRVPRLDIIPATQDLSGAEIELVDYEERTYRLDQALAQAPEGSWNICLIDCPQSLYRKTTHL